MKPSKAKWTRKYEDCFEKTILGGYVLRASLGGLGWAATLTHPDKRTTSKLGYDTPGAAKGAAGAMLRKALKDSGTTKFVVKVHRTVIETTEVEVHATSAHGAEEIVCESWVGGNWTPEHCGYHYEVYDA